MTEFDYKERSGRPSGRRRGIGSIFGGRFISNARITLEIIQKQGNCLPGINENIFAS